MLLWTSVDEESDVEGDRDEDTVAIVDGADDIDTRSYVRLRAVVVGSRRASSSLRVFGSLMQLFMHGSVSRSLFAPVQLVLDRSMRVLTSSNVIEEAEAEMEEEEETSDAARQRRGAGRNWWQTTSMTSTLLGSGSGSGSWFLRLLERRVRSSAVLEFWTAMAYSVGEIQTSSSRSASLEKSVMARRADLWNMERRKALTIFMGKYRPTSLLEVS